MTCFDMYVSERELPVRGCPHDYGYTKEAPKNCYCISCFKDCWSREVSTSCERKAREKN